jgi:hypothetical protein
VYATPPRKVTSLAAYEPLAIQALQKSQTSEDRISATQTRPRLPGRFDEPDPSHCRTNHDPRVTPQLLLTNHTNLQKTPCIGLSVRHSF